MLSHLIWCYLIPPLTKTSPTSTLWPSECRTRCQRSAWFRFKGEPSSQLWGMWSVTEQLCAYRCSHVMWCGAMDVVWCGVVWCADWLLNRRCSLLTYILSPIMQMYHLLLRYGCCIMTHWWIVCLSNWSLRLHAIIAYLTVIRPSYITCICSLSVLLPCPPSFSSSFSIFDPPPHHLNHERRPWSAVL